MHPLYHKMCPFSAWLWEENYFGDWYFYEFQIRVAKNCAQLILQMSRRAVNWCPGTISHKERFVLSKSRVIQNTLWLHIIAWMCSFKKSSLQLTILNPQVSPQSRSFKFNVRLLQGRHMLEVFVCLEVVEIARELIARELTGFLFILPNNNQTGVGGALKIAAEKHLIMASTSWNVGLFGRWQHHPFQSTSFNYSVTKQSFLLNVSRHSPKKFMFCETTYVDQAFVIAIPHISQACFKLSDTNPANQWRKYLLTSNAPVIYAQRLFSSKTLEH